MSWNVPVSEHSIAVPQSSLSPWLACGSPAERSAPPLPARAQRGRPWRRRPGRDGRGARRQAPAPDAGAELRRGRAGRSRRRRGRAGRARDERAPLRDPRPRRRADPGPGRALPPRRRRHGRPPQRPHARRGRHRPPGGLLRSLSPAPLRPPRRELLGLSPPGASGALPHRSRRSQPRPRERRRDCQPLGVPRPAALHARLRIRLRHHPHRGAPRGAARAGDARLPRHAEQGAPTGAGPRRRSRRDPPRRGRAAAARGRAPPSAGPRRNRPLGLPQPHAAPCAQGRARRRRDGGDADPARRRRPRPLRDRRPGR